LPPIQNSKKHFAELDGLRGIAAISVVIFHFMEVIITDYSRNFIGHGFLAVDFFFCLSGFVIAYAYDDRIEKMGKTKFFKARLIRLHPLVIFGSVLGLLGYLFDPFAAHSQSAGWLNITELFIASILMIPLPTMAERFFNLFSFNAPAWSLFWEYIANILYALFLHRLKPRYLALLMIPSAAAICLVAYNDGSLLGGWSGPTFWAGLARLSWSFLAGMFIYRSGWIIRNRLGFLPLSLLLFGAFLFPYSKLNMLWEPLIVIVWFPLLIALGAATTQSEKTKRLCAFSGNISYPLYMTHYWLIFIFAHYFELHHPAGLHLFFIVSACVAVMLLLAWLTYTFYDLPLRRKITKSTIPQTTKGNTQSTTSIL
jgi:peptidoglycan/LPS O-acetylase OafA/YrhL